MNSIAIIVSCYFNPVHKGHIEYFNLAKSRGDKLFVNVNNDYQRAKKEPKSFKKKMNVFLLFQISRA